MSTCSDSSFEFVSDPEGSDVEENSSTALTGALNPELRLSEPTFKPASDLSGETDSLLLLPNNKTPNSESLLPEMSSDLASELLLARIRVKTVQKALADTRNLESAKKILPGAPNLEHLGESEPDSIPAAVSNVKTSSLRAVASTPAGFTPRNQPVQCRNVLVLLFGLSVLCLSVFNHVNQPTSLPGDLKFQEEVETMMQRINKIRSNLTKISCLEDVPKKLMSKWKPDSSRFLGVEFSFVDYRLKTLVMTGTPVFEARNDNKVSMQLSADIIGEIWNSTEIIFNKGCVYISERKQKAYIKDGDLYIADNVTILVYTIPAQDLI